MKAIAYLALMAALGAPALVNAQEVDAGAAAGAAAGATTGSTSAAGSGSTSVGVSVDLDSMDELTTQLGASATATLDLSAVTETTTIHIVRVSTLEASTSGNMVSFKAAITANSVSLTKLRSDVGANAAIKAKLEAEGYTADDVVAVVKNEADASITVYVDDSA